MLPPSPQSAQDTTEQAAEQAAEYIEAAKQLAITYGPRILAAIVILVVGWFVAKSITGLVRKGMTRASVDAPSFQASAARTVNSSRLGVRPSAFHWPAARSAPSLSSVGFGTGRLLRQSLRFAI